MRKYLRSFLLWFWSAIWFPLQLTVSVAAIIFFGAYLKYHTHMSALEYEAKMGFIVGVWMTLQVELLIYRLWKEHRTDKEPEEQERRNHRECQRRK